MNLSYLITVTPNQLVPAKVLLQTLRDKTDADIFIVGPESLKGKDDLVKAGAIYIAETDIDCGSRFPGFMTRSVFNLPGWTKQHMIRLCADLFIKTQYVVVMEAETFVFDNWDESRLFHEGKHRTFHWIPFQNVSPRDISMYSGSAFILRGIPGLEGIMNVPNMAGYKRHISGMAIWSNNNLKHLWSMIPNSKLLLRNLIEVTQHAFSDYEMYGLAADYSLFDMIDRPIQTPDIYGWIDEHATDKNFGKFKSNAMWGINKITSGYVNELDYKDYIQAMARVTGKSCQL